MAKQCEECLKFITNICAGKAARKKAAKYFGTEPDNVKPSGLKFCDQYEFDVRLYKFKDGVTFRADTYEDIRARQVIKIEEQETMEHADLVDMAADLNLEDFAHLL